MKEKAIEHKPAQLDLQGLSFQQRQQSSYFFLSKVDCAGPYYMELTCLLQQLGVHAMATDPQVPYG